MNKTEQFNKRLIDFVVAIINIFKKLPRNIENIVFFKQIVRSSSSIGANYQEAQSSITKKEFIQKLSISLKESYETCYWLELTSTVNKIDLKQIINEATEIKKIISSIILTSKKSLVPKSTILNIKS